MATTVQGQLFSEKLGDCCTAGLLYMPSQLQLLITMTQVLNGLCKQYQVHYNLAAVNQHIYLTCPVSTATGDHQWASKPTTSARSQTLSLTITL